MKKLTTFLIIAGILIAISPIAGKFYVEWRESRLLDEWYNSEDATDAEALAAMAADPEEGYGLLEDAFAADARNSQDGDNTAVAGSESASGNGSTSDNTGNTSGNTTDNTSSTTQAGSGPKTKPKPATQHVVIGVIKIDKIKIKYPIIEGVKASSLKVGIGHIPGTAGLGQSGNCALAGHRNYTFGRFFNRLDELKAGDIISISTKKEEFKYKVYEKLVVKPDDVSVIKGGKDDTVLTMITCTPIYVATHRLIVHARLVEKVLLKP